MKDKIKVLTRIARKPCSTVLGVVFEIARPHTQELRPLGWVDAATAFGDRINDGYVVAVRKHSLNEVPANKASPASHQYAHLSPRIGTHRSCPRNQP